MAVKTYKLGQVVVAGATVLNCTNAALTIAQEVSDRTSIGDSWRFLGTLGKSWALSITCKYDPVGTTLTALRTEFITGDCETGSIKMYEGTTTYFSGSAAMITGYNLTKSVGADDEVTMTFEGNSVLEYTA
jgi:hypothetical protein